MHWKVVSCARLLVFLLLPVFAYTGDAVTQAILREVCGHLYQTLPDADSCYPGDLSESEEQAALDAFNRIRRLHGLQPVVLDDQFRDEARYAALIVAVNRNMSHTPSPDSYCYTAAGRRGSWESNLAFHVTTIWDPTYRGVRQSKRSTEVAQLLRKKQISTSALLSSLLIDLGTQQLGHRRWMLDPYIHRIAFARTDLVSRKGHRWELRTGAALHLIAGQRPSVTLPPRTMIAWPYGDYPDDLFDPRAWFSFQIMASSDGPTNSSSVDFRSATVRITDPSGNPVPIRDVHSDNDGYGLPNLIRWHADRIRPGIRYTVEIGPVRILRNHTRFQYTFRIVKPDAQLAEN